MKKNSVVKIFLSAVFFLNSSFAFAQNKAFNPSELGMVFGEGTGRTQGSYYENGVLKYTYVKNTFCYYGTNECFSEMYRTSNVSTQVDGKFVSTQVVDRFVGSSQNRGSAGSPLNNGGQSGASTNSADYTQGKSSTNSGTQAPPSIKYDGFERIRFSTQSEQGLFSFDLSSQAYKEFMNVAPSVAVALANTVNDLRATAEASARLQQEIVRLEQQLSRVHEGARIRSQNIYSATQLQNYHTLVQAFDSLNRSAEKNASSQLSSYGRAIVDPLRYEKYELAPSNRLQMLKDASAVARYGLIDETLAYSEALFNQVDSKRSAEAREQLSEYFNDGVVLTKKFGAKNGSPLESHRFETSMDQLEGQLLRRVANKAQVQWVKTKEFGQASVDKKAAYYTAVASLKSADQEIQRGNIDAALDLIKVADSLINFSKGVVSGVIKSVTGAIDAIPELGKAVVNFASLSLESPDAAAKKVADVVESIPGMVGAIATHYLALGDDILSGDSYQKGHAIGQLGGDILTAIATDGAVASLKGVAKVGIIGATEGPVFAKSLALAKSLDGYQRSVFAQVLAKDPAAAVGVMRGLAGADQRIGAEFAGFVLSDARIATMKSTLALSEAVEQGVIKTPQQFELATKLAPKMEKMPHRLDFRLIGDSEKIALIGQDMDRNVLKVRQALLDEGIHVEVFKLSRVAELDWKRLNALHPNGVPNTEILTSVGYIENQKWIQKLIDENYTVLDANNPLNKGYSLYYHSLERAMLSKVLKK